MRPHAFLLLALCAASLTTLPARAALAQEGTAVRTTDAQKLTDEALQTVLTRGARATPEDLDRLAQALRQSLTDARSRERVLGAIVELQERAKTQTLTEARVRAVVTDVHDVRFDMAMAELVRKAEAKKVIDMDFESLRAAMAARQQAAQGTELDLRAHATRLQEAITAMRKAAASAAPSPREVESLQLDVADSRVQVGLEWLAQQAAARGLARSDYARPRELFAVLSGMNDPQVSTLAKRLSESLDQLERRAAGGGAVTREEFTALREQWIARAREAGATR